MTHRIGDHADLRDPPLPYLWDQSNEAPWRKLWASMLKRAIRVMVMLAVSIVVATIVIGLVEMTGLSVVATAE
jgi:hypothetical protein